MKEKMLSSIEAAWWVTTEVMTCLETLLIFSELNSATKQSAVQWSEQFTKCPGCIDAALSSSTEALLIKCGPGSSQSAPVPNQKAINLDIYINLFLNKQMAVPTETKQTCVVYCIWMVAYEWAFYSNKRPDTSNGADTWARF